MAFAIARSHVICTDGQSLLKSIQSGSVDTSDLRHMLDKLAGKTLIWYLNRSRSWWVGLSKQVKAMDVVRSVVQERHHQSGANYLLPKLGIMEEALGLWLSELDLQQLGSGPVFFIYL